MTDEIKVGDRFLVEVRVVRRDGDIHIRVPADGDDMSAWTVPVSVATIGRAKRLPRALKVGDRVRVHDSAPVTLKAIDGVDAWVKTDAGGRFTTELGFLTLAEESAP